MLQQHQPVLLREVLQVLLPSQGKRILDGTFGRGGHSKAFLDAGANVIALDQDPQAVQTGMRLSDLFAKEKFKMLHMNFRKMNELEELKGMLDGILLDLGVSSPQLDEASRGFSFSKDGPLDMRMNPSEGLPASYYVNSMPLDELARIIRDYGGEARAKSIAHAIGRARASEEIASTARLARIIEDVTGPHRKHIHPATKTFQALRILVNDELNAVDEALLAIPDLLRSGGVFAIISFHELEDRKIKQFIERTSAKELRGPASPFGFPNPDYRFEKLGRWKPQDNEIKSNPRSRSACLRAARRI